MSLIKEAEENLYFMNEVLFDGALKEYRFEGKNGPIIGIHGAGLSGWPKSGLRDFMAKYDVKGTLLHFGILTKKIEDYLPILNYEVEKYSKPTLVGFSAGGFIALRYAQVYGWGKINKIITIATPFNGISKKYSTFGKIIQETIPGSPLLKEIVAIKPPEGKVVSIFAKDDIHTPHPENINLNWELVITDAESHAGIQNQKKWFEETLKREIGIIQ